MHYYLADRAAREIDPTSVALLLDGEGHLCEASTANVLVFFPDEGLVSPPRDQVLPGVSLGFVAQLARQTGVAFSHRTVRREEVSQATEVLLTSTPYCLLPVVQVDGKPVGSGRPGTVFQQLLAAWNAAVGVDIARQAHEFAVRKQIAAS
jgi:branched-subunit amino acid aminotransferase/4-amino-4-deoxychorismate lyase